MIILEVVSAAGGLCGAWALLHQIGDRRARRLADLAALIEALAHWEALSPKEQAEAREELAEVTAEAAEIPDPCTLLANLRRAVTRLEGQRRAVAAPSCSSPFEEAASLLSRTGAAALLRDGRAAVQGRRHA